MQPQSLGYVPVLAPNMTSPKVTPWACPEWSWAVRLFFERLYLDSALKHGSSLGIKLSQFTIAARSESEVL